MLTINAAIIYGINVTRTARNYVRYHHKTQLFHSICATIAAKVKLSCSSTKLPFHHSVFDFLVLKAFHIPLNMSRAPIIKEVIWHPPCQGWVKCNVDGSSVMGASSLGCGGIFCRNSRELSLAFAEPLSWNNSFIAQFYSVLRGIEIAFDRGWSNLWVESDSTIVVNGFCFVNEALIPWQLRNRWNFCTKLLLDMNFIISYICREGNSCAYFFGKLGCITTDFTFFLFFTD